MGSISTPALEVKSFEFLSGGGGMGELIRNFDWSKTPLGPPSNWPQSLRTTVSICISSGFPMLVCWGPGLIMIYNDGYIPVVGSKHPASLGQPLYECWFEIKETLETMFNKVLKSGEAIYAEDLRFMLGRHGYIEETYFTFSYSPIYDESTSIGGVLVTCSETTDKVINERRLITLNKLSENISAAKDHESIYKKSIEILQQNPEDFPFALLYKLGADGKTISVSERTIDDPVNFPGEIDISSSAVNHWLAKTIDSKRPVLLDDVSKFYTKLPTGAWEKEPEKIFLLPICNTSEKNPFGLLVTGLNPHKKFDHKYRDFLQLVADQIAAAIVNVNRHEEERKRAEELAKLDKTKTLFFSNISHEFRTPITLMLGPLEELINKPSSNLTKNDKENIQTTYRNAMRLLKLVNTLLDFSRIESGRQQARYMLTDISSLTKNLASNFRSIVEKAGLKFIVKADDIIQPVYLDRLMWEKIVFNLLSNAFKYTLDGSITVAVSASESHAILIVEDTGVGIPEKELPHMFERFHRVENVTGRTFEGTGIGLSLIKELIKLHGGTISVKSKVGKGSVFTVTIPFGKSHLHDEKVVEGKPDIDKIISSAFVEEAISLLEINDVDADADDSNLSLISEQIKQNGEDSSKELVLIVDDNADMRHYLENLIQTKFNTITAVNGLDALTKIEKYSPSLILSDIMMPVMDGIQLLKEVRENEKTTQIPFILITARAGEESKIEGYETGADDYLVKPFSAKELLARVNAQVTIARKRAVAQQNIYKLFFKAPFLIAILKGEELTIDFVNEKILAVAKKEMEEVLNRSLFDVIPELRISNLSQILKNVLHSGSLFLKNEQAIEINIDGNSVTHYFNVVIEALREEEGKISGVLLTGFDVTEQVIARKKVEENEQQFRNILLQSPNIFVILQGPEMTITFANDPLFRSWGKDSSIIGKTILEVLPEIKDQPFPKLLQNVYCTGEIYIGREEKAVLLKEGVPVDKYYNYVYQPIFDENKKVTGITAMANDITEQVIARKEIEEKERALRELSEFDEAIMNNMGEGLYTVDENGILTTMNSAAEKLFGWTEDELRGKKMHDITHYKHRDGRLFPAEECPGLKVLQTSKAVNNVEDVFIRKDGTFFDVMYSTSPLIINGNKKGLIVVFRDITEIKKAEMALKESEGKFRFLFDSNILGVCFWHIDGRVYEANDLMLSLLGYSREEMKNGKLNWRKFTLPEDAPIHEEKVKEAISGKSISPYETYYIHKDGRHIPTLVGYAMLAGSKELGIAFFHDISKLKEAEAQIRENEKKFRQIADTMPQMVWTSLSNGEFDYYNKRWYEYTGLENGSLLNCWANILHPEDAELFNEKFNHSINTGQPFELEFRLKEKESPGNFRWFLGKALPVINEHGKITRWYGTCTDIHEHKMLAEEKLLLEIRNQELKDQQKNNFIQMASHELKTPVTSILGYVQFLMKSFNHPNEATLSPVLLQSSLTSIEKQIRRVSRLIAELLDISKIEAGELELKHEIFNLNALINDIRQDVLHTDPKRKILLSHEFACDIYGDKDRIGQVIINLMTNALKFSPAHEAVEISVKKFNEKMASITITDHGIGIDKEEHERIFERFYRSLNKEVNTYPGFGIGLFIARDIIRKHGGAIRVESEKGRGSSFTVVIPFIQ